MRIGGGNGAQRGLSERDFVALCYMLARVDQWARLGEAVRRDRIRAGLRHQADLAARAGVSRSTLSKIERGIPGNYSDYTRSGIEGALGWSHGTFDRLLGSGPVNHDDQLRERLNAVWARLTDDQRRVVLAAAEAFIVH